MILPGRRTALVVDASVVLKWFLVEPDAEVAARLRDEPEFDLHAPAHWLAEVTNVLWVRTRLAGAGGIEVAQAGYILPVLQHASVESHPLAAVLAPAFEIATRCGVTMYDALYVATAELLDVPFVTADARLVRRLSDTRWADRVLPLRGFEG